MAKKNENKKRPVIQVKTFNWKAVLRKVEIQGENDSYKSELLTSEVLTLLKPNMDKVNDLIKSGTDHDKEIAEHLFKISVQLNNFASKLHGDDKKAINKNSKEAIRELAKKDFNFRPSRAFEYIRLAKSESVMKLKLSISHLIELSRLNEVDLQNLLKEKQEKDLAKMKFLQIQTLVKDFNSSKRKSKTKNATPTITSDFKKFVCNIDKVQDSFTENTLDDFSVKKLEAFATWAMKTANNYYTKKVA